jgi:acetyltransferase
VGFHRDPVFGPIIALGAGGILAEFLPNHAVALPPVNPYWANDLLQQSGLAPILGAHRGKAACDLLALSDLICRVSDMSHDLKAVLAVDINPLLCSPTGVLAVDARMQLQTEPA